MIKCWIYQDGSAISIISDSTNGCKKDESLGTFLLTLKNPHGLDPILFRFRFRLKADGSNAIKCNSDQLAFGSHNGISVSDKCDLNMSNNTNIDQSFANSTKIESKVLFDGVCHFTVAEIAVLVALH
jgi:hypothetical protein